MVIDLYYNTGSPPCQSVMIAAKALGVTLNIKFLDFETNEHMKSEFLKVNPQHTVPTIDDSGFFLSESRAILGYLVDQYAKDDSMYPKDPKRRAIVNQKLDFDLSTLYARLADNYYPIFYGDTCNPKSFGKLEEAFEILDKFLEGQEWVAGSNMTIADISTAISVMTAVTLDFPVQKFPNVSKWLETCKKKIPSFDEITREEMQLLKQLYNKCAGK